MPLTAEHARLADPAAWRAWGPYVADRQWGTVREDYSPTGDAWGYLPFAHAHLRAYRWGEDGLAGVSDEHQKLCLAVALWNEADPILKERLFGLTNAEGNHGEDVKEAYFPLDATPTHSYLRFLYKYPQRAFPYQQLVEENGRRGRLDREYELADTGAFAEGRYFDVEIEYAKASPDNLVMRVTAHNRGPEPAPLHILPHLWFRNTWSWVPDVLPPSLRSRGDIVRVEHPDFPGWVAACDGGNWLFCENETNSRVLFDSPGPQFPKDAIGRRVVRGQADAVNPQRVGTKAAAWRRFKVPAGGSVAVRLVLGRTPPVTTIGLAGFVDSIITHRRTQADEFYADLQQHIQNEDARRVQRQAFAGLIWSKQFYSYDVRTWLKGDPAQPPPPPARKAGRNADWDHLSAADIICMPDKWEYPWFAAWDSAFHMIPIALVDPDFAKRQLLLFLRHGYLNPNGQIPAYEWNFGDVNPPVQAWACWRVFQIDRKHHRREEGGGGGDRDFLERAFHKLLLNFTWWVNRKDPAGRNVFQGGFLGLDNIGVFDRSQPLPTGGHLNQADATAWVAMYSLNLMRIALELARTNPAYQDIAAKFFRHFLQIADAMTDLGGVGLGLWDEQDQFYYDDLVTPDGQMIPLRVRSLVGLIPLFAVEVLDPNLIESVPDFVRQVEQELADRPDYAALVSRWSVAGRGESRLLSLLRGHRLKKLLRRMLDAAEFLSDHGVRSLSKYHEGEPYRFRVPGNELTVTYTPGESESGMFGGNSNWRGPVWLPVNYLIVESLQRFHHYYGDNFRVEHPTGSGTLRTLSEIADDLSARLVGAFVRNADGRRAVFGDDEQSQRDEHFRDCLVFPEHLHGETGRGLGALHQTGWTALVAKLLMPRG